MVGTEPLTSVAPPPCRSYDDAALPFGAPPNASDTTRVSSPAKAKPNGVGPDDATQVGAPATPSSSSGKTSTQLVAFSVTISASPRGVIDTCAPPAVGLVSARIEPGIGVSRPLPSSRKPAIEPVPPALST